MIYFKFLFNWFLDIFELVSDELFWSNLFGERLFTLFKRYAGNDALLICLVVSLLPAISNITSQCYTYVRRRIRDLFYVSIVIGHNELIYAPVDEYLTKHFEGINKLRHVRGKTGYENDPQQTRPGFYSRPPLNNDDGNRPLIDLTPAKYTEFKLRHKGHNIYINRMDEEFSSDVGRMSPWITMSSLKTDIIVVQMLSRDLPKLRGFIQDWLDVHYEERRNKLTMYKCNFYNHGWEDDNDWRECGCKKIRSFNSVVLKKGDQEKIHNDIATFKESKEWYDERGIPYRRGYLLHGPPGTGKTSFIQSIASKLGMNVAILNLSGAPSDEALIDSFGRVPRGSILVIEDIDHYKFEEGVSDSKSSDDAGKKKNSVSVSGILNAIDGIASLEESIIFMTCNDMNSIPPALLRPGRIDFKLHMGYIDNYQAELIFWKFFCMTEKEKKLEDIPREKYPLLRDTINELIQRIRAGAKKASNELEISPAEIISYFLFHALKHNLSKNPEATKDCFQSLLNHVPDFIESIAADRQQALEHAEKKNASTVDDKVAIIKKTFIPTPPSSPAAEKTTASTEADEQKGDE